ncbi:MAG: hypothetical protein H0U75_10900 [Legionella sp.]|nr:hypothetical protein [Legionella sp.]
MLNRLATEKIDLNHPSDYKLTPEAMLKLPKHGDILEVQHEAIALNISRQLDHKTTQSTMVSYNSNPALFIPFEKIDTLKAFAKGKPESDYLKDSTIKSVGEGFEADQCVDDLGKILGLLYVSSDPDAIGKNNQNKALMNGRDLYVFDQVIKGSDTLSLDSRASLIPSTWKSMIPGVARHFICRNRSMINDSSVNAKVDSIAKLVRKETEILDNVRGLFFTHMAALKKLDSLEKNSENVQTKATLILLRDDAQTMLHSLERRIQTAFQGFPRLDGKPILPSIAFDEDKLSLLKQTITLEMMFNKPRLYSDDGRAYKHVNTEPHGSKILEVSLNKDPRYVYVHFDKVLDPQVIKTYFSDAIISDDRKTLKMTHAEYNKFSENTLFPESDPVFAVTNTYLSMEKIYRLSESYGSCNVPMLKAILKNYESTMNKPISNEDKIQCIQVAMEKIQTQLIQASDKGFPMHVIKILNRDI